MLPLLRIIFQSLFEAIEIPREGKEPVTLEVEKDLGNGIVRCVAMATTDGLERGMPARRTGAPIMVPVGLKTLGRIFNVLGKPVDNRGPVVSEQYYPIHRRCTEF